MATISCLRCNENIDAPAVAGEYACPTCGWSFLVAPVNEYGQKLPSVVPPPPVEVTHDAHSPTINLFVNVQQSSPQRKKKRKVETSHVWTVTLAVISVLIVMFVLEYLYLKQAAHETKEAFREIDRMFNK